MPCAARRAIRGMAAVACVYGAGFGDRRVFSLASGDARTRVGGKLVLVFPGQRGTSFSGWSKAKSALDTASSVSGWWLRVRLEVTEAVLSPKAIYATPDCDPNPERLLTP
jgi:hypothetical protein